MLHKILPNMTDIYAITDSRLSLGRSVQKISFEILESGIKIIQYREKKLSKEEMLYECMLLRKMTYEYNACFIVNDYIDIAIKCNADGIHIGQNDIPPKEARELLGKDSIIGLSTHSPEQALNAIKAGVDYIGVGPIFETRTKEDVVAPVGLEYLDWVKKNTSIPCVAIGGIKVHNINSVVKHGATCCALVSEIVSAPDISAKIAEIRKAMHG